MPAFRNEWSSGFERFEKNRYLQNETKKAVVVHKNVIKGGGGLLYGLSIKRDDFLNMETVLSSHA
ncbi:hypothetical protein C1H71_19460 [Iodobacter fluviatilis]|uniref:Uncharacterized protein n=1 Tax=Iodobacter fluviatilis TaxID=537 RepID=A0A7G3GDR8_9NEIS|nr:hypothetical protein C1H71_19460 [Iodobacter fluviatilis]